MKEKKKKLFRSENRITHNHTDRDLNYRSRWERHSKGGMRSKMKNSASTGYHLDYTPLFKFLLSKNGEAWDEVWKECLERVDKVDPILWMVQGIRANGLPNSDDKNPEYYPKSFRYREGASFSTMYVDDSGILRIVDENYKDPLLFDYCRCVGETFNGNLYETYKRPKNKIDKMKSYIKRK